MQESGRSCKRKMSKIDKGERKKLVKNSEIFVKVLTKGKMWCILMPSYEEVLITDG